MQTDQIPNAREARPAKPQRDALGRRNRLRPFSTGKRVTLTERDWLWLQKIHEHGPLASSFLLAFAKDTGRNQKRATERLTDLFNETNTKHGGAYLTRPMQQFATVDARYNQLVYDLAPAAIRALKERGLWHETNAARSGPWLHNFMVSSITSSIEIETRERNDLEYIPAYRILERANTTLSWPVTFRDPTTEKFITKDLKPDALFGLEYKTADGPRYRFFVVEADRATEPLTASSVSRKSGERNLLQYDAYIGSSAYKQHLHLTAPLIFLMIVTSINRLERHLEIAAHKKRSSAAMLFQVAEGIDKMRSSPKPSFDLLGQPWITANELPINISECKNEGLPTNS